MEYFPTAAPVKAGRPQLSTRVMPHPLAQQIKRPRKVHASAQPTAGPSASSRPPDVVPHRQEAALGAALAEHGCGIRFESAGYRRQQAALMQQRRIPVLFWRAVGSCKRGQGRVRVRLKMRKDAAYTSRACSTKLPVGLHVQTKACAQSFEEVVALQRRRSTPVGRWRIFTFSFEMHSGRK